MEKITLQELENSYPSTSQPQFLRSRDDSGNLSHTPTATFVRADSNSLVRALAVGHNQLVTLVNRAPKWNRFTVFCIIGSSNALVSAEVRITGTYNYQAQKPYLSAVISGKLADYIKFYYKIIDDTLSVYIHCTTTYDSPCSMLCMSSYPITMSTEDDISTYTEITFTKD